MKLSIVVLTSLVLGCTTLVAQNNNPNTPKGLLPKGTLAPLNNGSNNNNPTPITTNNNAGFSGLTDAPLNGGTVTTSTTTVVTNGGSLLPLNTGGNNLAKPQQQPPVQQNMPSLTPLNYGSNNITSKSLNNNSQAQPIQQMPSLSPLNSGGSNNQNASASQNNNQNLPALSPLPTSNYSQPTTNKIGGVTTNQKIEPLSGYDKYNQSLNNYNSNPKNTNTNGGFTMPPLSNDGIKKSLSNNNDINLSSMPPLAGIEGQYNSAYKSNKSSSDNGMPALASIEKEATPEAVPMPELAAIEGNNASTNNNKKIDNNPMPELGTLDDGNKRVIVADDGSYILKSVTVPTGTTIESSLKRAVIIKPNVIVRPQPVDPNTPIENTNLYKPHAGGNGLDLFDEEEQQPTYQTNVVYQQAPPPPTQQRTVYATAPQQQGVVYNPQYQYQAPVQQYQQPVQYQQQYQQPVQQQRVVYQQQQQPQMVYQNNYQQVQTTTTTTSTPCNHVNHNTTYTCPCCVKAPVKKWKPKKVWKPAPKPQVVYQYVYVEPQPQPQMVQPQPHVEERVVFVPQQQVTYQQQQKVYQPITERPAEAPKQRVVYTDYTKTMYQPEAQQQQNCQCPTMPITYQTPNAYNNATRQPQEAPQQQYQMVKAPNQQGGAQQQYQQPVQQTQQKAAASLPAYAPTGGQRFVYPNNMAAQSAGPTSGDFPMAGYTTDDPLRYAFYMNKLGKYSVVVYNANFKLILSQNGKVLEYNILQSDPSDATNGKPKLNSFGFPEKLAGIPILYNYNRSISKIGNIKFDYDFEGFFKNVNGSSVFYNSRSSLQRVDNINVQYDAAGYVSGVDTNNGLVNMGE